MQAARMLLLAFGLLGEINAWAQSSDFTFSEGGDTLVAYSGAGGEVTVPDVKVIGTAFVFNQTLTGVTIPASVEAIGGAAFSACMSLSRVTFAEGSNLKSIGVSAFGICTTLTGISLPSGLTEIGQSAFNATGLTSIVIPNGVKSIPYMTFYYCRALRTITLGSGVETIGSEAFLGVTGLEEMHVLAAVPPQLGNKTFGDRESDYDNVPASCVIYVPKGSSAAYQAADGWKDFTNIVEEEWTTPIEDFTFSASGDTLVRYIGEGGDVVIPGNLGIKVIAASAFSQKNRLTGVVIPSGVTTIEAQAFYYCTSLTAVTLPSSLRTIGSYAFNNCSALTDITFPDGLTSIGSYAFAYSGLTTVSIPNSVATLDAFAFLSCTNLTTAIVGDGVTNMNATFFNCVNLGTIVIGKNVRTLDMPPFMSTSSIWLGAIIMRCPKPPAITHTGNITFFELPGIRTLYIPKGTRKAYRDRDTDIKGDTSGWARWATHIIDDIPAAANDTTIYTDTLQIHDTTRLNDTIRTYIHDTIRYQHVRDTTITTYIHDTLHDTLRHDTTMIIHRDTTLHDTLTLNLNIHLILDTLRLLDTTRIPHDTTRTDTLHHTANATDTTTTLIRDTTHIPINTYDTIHTPLTVPDPTLPPPVLLLHDTVFLPHDTPALHYLILDPTDGTGLSVAPSVGVRASAAEGGIMLEGLTAGEGFAVYSVEGLLLVRGVAGADGRCLLRDLAGGTYLLGHGGRWGRFVHN